MNKVVTKCLNDPATYSQDQNCTNAEVAKMKLGQIEREKEVEKETENLNKIK
jgi:hypothetical protein